jgi:hypothetical protein
MLLWASFALSATDVTDKVLGHGSTCDPTQASVCDVGLACSCKKIDRSTPSFTKVATGDKSPSSNSAPHLETNFPDLGQGLPGLTPAGKAFYAVEFREILRSRMTASGRKLAEEAEARGCACLPVKESLDLSAAPVFQANYPKGFGVANPVNRDTAGAVTNPNWDACGHCTLPRSALHTIPLSARPYIPADTLNDVDRVTVTERINDAWWGVDLGHSRSVHSIRMQNRADCCPWRLEGINVYLGEHGNTDLRFIENSMVVHDKNVPQNVPLFLPINATGRYLFVRRLTAGGHYSGLTLCELEVYEQ